MLTPKAAADLSTAESKSANVAGVGTLANPERTRAIGRSIFECRLRCRITDWDCIIRGIGGAALAAPDAVIAISAGTRSSPAIPASMRGSGTLILRAVIVAA